MNQIPIPLNSTALAFYLLLTNPLYGVSSYEAVLSDKFFKLSTRISDLIRTYKVNIHKKPENGKNRFGHPYANIRYCLYQSDLEQNIKIYNEINSKK